MISNVFSLALVTGSFVLLLVVIPWVVLGFKFKAGDLIDNLFKSLIIGMTVVVNLVYLLALLKILSVYTLVGTYLFVGVIFMLTFKRKKLKHIVNYMLDVMRRTVDGIYRPKLLFLFAMKLAKNRIKRDTRHGFFYHPFNSLFFLIALGYGMYIRGYHAMTKHFFAFSDMYVHTDWIKNLQAGNIFSDGVYPFGMHNVVYALNEIFRIDVVTIMRYLGVVISLFFLLSVYRFAKKIFRSPLAANIAMFIFCISDIIPYQSYSRQSSALPQEMGMMLLLPAAYFLIDYLRDKKRSDLVYFGFAAALTFTCHFYITIVLLMMCACILAVNFFSILKKKQLASLALAAVMIAVFSIAPLYGGILRGIEWQGSMRWAISFLNGTNDEFMKNEEEKKARQNSDIGNDTGTQEEQTEQVSEEEVQTVNASPDSVISDSKALPAKSGGLLSYIDTESETQSISGAAAENVTQSTTENTTQNADEGTAEKTADKTGGGLKSLLSYSGFKAACEELSPLYLNTLRSFYLNIILILVMLAYGVLLILFKKHRFYGKILIAFSGFSAILFSMMFWSKIGLPEVFERSRLQIFLVINMAYLFALPFEIVFSGILGENHKSKRSIAATFLVCVSLLGYYFGTGRSQPLAFALQAQYDGAVDVYYQIKEHFPKNNWTIVSPVDEVCMVKNQGYHYELVDFIFKDLAEMGKRKPLKIPTEYIFFYVEKKPLEAFRTLRYYDMSQTNADLEPISVKDAEVTNQQIFDMHFGAPSEYYTNVNSRRVLEARLQQWILAYQKCFPEELKVYYEDNDLIVYMLHQNVYNVNNLIIDYGYN